MIKNKTVRYFLHFLILITSLYIVYIVTGVFVPRDLFNKMDPEIHYIPNNYIGDVKIEFNQKDGSDKESYKGARVYRIPDSGVLKTKFKPNKGFIDSEKDIKFYYVLDGNLKELPKIISSGDRGISYDSNTVIVSNYFLVRRSLGKQINTEYEVDSMKNF